MPGILIIDDNEDVLFAAELLLRKYYKKIKTSKDPNILTDIIGKEFFDVILLDMNFTKDSTCGKEGFYWLRKILDTDPSAVVVMITSFGDVDTAVKAIKEGAVDFVLKPWQNEKFLATISAAAELSASRKEVNLLRARQKDFTREADRNFRDIIGESPGIKEVFTLIRKVAGTDANVLIRGENGTGKELAARAIHRASERSDEVFVSVDLGAVPASLFESELFGHVKGAFTDARDDRVGRFEIASGGTIFLDEIANVPVELQAKLLSVIQNKKVSRIGSNNTIEVDVRIICATNADLEKLVEEGSFREDLLYRIKTIEIELPPLREREGDVKLLTDYFLNKYSGKYGKGDIKLSQEAEKELLLYNWPGNVRQLQHTLERGVILCESGIITAEDLALKSGKAKTINTGTRLNLDEIEKNAIVKAVEKHNGNISKAAKELGLTRASLYRRLEKFGL